MVSTGKPRDIVTWYWGRWGWGLGGGGSKMQKSSRSNQPCKREVLSEGCVWLISCHFLVYFVGRFPFLALFVECFPSPPNNRVQNSIFGVAQVSVLPELENVA